MTIGVIFKPCCVIILMDYELLLGHLGDYIEAFELLVQYHHTGRGRRHSDDKDEDDDESSDEEFPDDADASSESNDPYYLEDVEFNPNFKQISTYVKSLRFDKIIRVGLGITQSACDNAFFSSRFRLNGTKLLKLGTKVYAGDKLDMITDSGEEPVGKRVRVVDFMQTKSDSYKFYYVKSFLVSRPPLAIFSLVLLLCAIALISIDIEVNQSPPPNDPDVEKHWNKLLLELSGLEFCFSNSSNSRLVAESYEGAHVLRGLDNDQRNTTIISHAIYLPLVIYPNAEFIYHVPYLLTAQMRGRHIGIQGQLALQRLNISFTIPSVEIGKNHKNPGSNFVPIHLKACVTFTATQDIFPQTLLPRTCKPNSLKGDTSARISFLEWSKRSDVFDSNRCYTRTRIQTEFHVAAHLLPRLKEADILLISFRLRFLVCVVLVLLSLFLVFGARIDMYSPCNQECMERFNKS
ncbi:unnamed protein product [Trichobilharzia szidati]|nr:unnamed protein product [Trichobilharzia szidati]